MFVCLSSGSGSGSGRIDCDSDVGALVHRQKLRVKHWKGCRVNIPLQLHSGGQLCNANKTRNYILLGLRGDGQRVKLSVQNPIEFLLAEIARQQTGHGAGNKGRRGRGGVWVKESQDRLSHRMCGISVRGISTRYVSDEPTLQKKGRTTWLPGPSCKGQLGEQTG